jgi:GNAT superfamily N-acetyltransferase
MYKKGLHTDFMLLRPFSDITEHDDYMRVVSHGFPNYYFGNMLVLRHPPQDPDPAISLFRDAFRDHPDVEHVTLCWDSAPLSQGAQQAFEGLGFDYDLDTVLTSSRPTSPGDAPHGITFRMIVAEQEWDQVIALQYQTGKDDFANYRSFIRQKFDTHRQRVALGLGHWYGAFDVDELVSDMGLFAENSVARYQSVETHAQYRGRGIASSLIQFAAQDMAQRHNIETFVIVAEAASNAQRLYQKCGFVPSHDIFSLFRGPKNGT